MKKKADKPKIKKRVKYIDTVHYETIAEIKLLAKIILNSRSYYSFKWSIDAELHQYRKLEANFVCHITTEQFKELGELLARKGKKYVKDDLKKEMNKK